MAGNSMDYHNHDSESEDDCLDDKGANNGPAVDNINMDGAEPVNDASTSSKQNGASQKEVDRYGFYGGNQYTNPQEWVININSYTWL